MTDPERNPNPDPSSDRLPADRPVEAELRALDERLVSTARALRRIETPDGLEDRVYASSVRLLPRRSRRAASRTSAGRALRLPDFASLTRSLTGRLALAASLGVACVLAWSVMNRPAGPGPVAPGGPGPDAIAAADPMAQVALDLAWLAGDEAFEDMDRTVAHLLDTRGLTMADLTGEMGSIVAASEM